MDKEIKQEVFEYRGIDSLYLAIVLKDTAEEFTCEEPVHFAYVAEIGKTTDSGSESHYYDNKPMIVVSSESDDKITIVVAPPELERLSAITGKSFDPETGMMVEGPSKNDYWAIMYRTKGTDGAWRYVSRLKGRFGTPEESTKSEDDGTETTNTSIEFTGIYTTHEFDKGRYNDTAKKWEKGSAKGIVVDERYGKADVSTFFEKVQTPDTIKATTASDPQTQSAKSSKSVN